MISILIEHFLKFFASVFFFNYYCFLCLLHAHSWLWLSLRFSLMSISNDKLFLAILWKQGLNRDKHKFYQLQQNKTPFHLISFNLNTDCGVGFQRLSSVGLKMWRDLPLQCIFKQTIKCLHNIRFCCIYSSRHIFISFQSQDCLPKFSQQIWSIPGFYFQVPDILQLQHASKHNIIYIIVEEIKQWSIYEQRYNENKQLLGRSKWINFLSSELSSVFLYFLILCSSKLNIFKLIPRTN